jgi:hypothetical protein
MFDGGIAIIDRIISLIKVRQENRRKLFIDHVEPLFKDIEQIHIDYLKGFTDLLETIHSFPSEEEIRTHLLHKKAELENLRVKVNSCLKFHQKRQFDLSTSFESFVFACLIYFGAQSGEILGKYGLFYTDLIGILDRKHDSFSMPPDLKKSDLKPEPRFTMELALQAILNEVRKRWEYVTEKYSECRYELLK